MYLSGMRLPHPRPKQNTAYFALKLPPELLESSQQTAAAESRSLADVVREFLRKYSRKAGRNVKA